MVSAAPAGLIIWILANVHLDNQATLLTSLTGFLDPFARAWDGWMHPDRLSSGTSGQ